MSAHVPEPAVPDKPSTTKESSKNDFADKAMTYIIFASMSFVGSAYCFWSMTSAATAPLVVLTLLASVLLFMGCGLFTTSAIVNLIHYNDQLHRKP